MKDKRAWRKLVKKLRRKRIRTKLARERDKPLCPEYESDESEEEVNPEEDLKHEEEEAKWLEREKQAQLQFEQRKADEQLQKDLEKAERKRIRQEWEELQAKQEVQRKEQEELEAQRKEMQVLCKFWGKLEKEKQFSEFLDFLAGDIETPPLPYLMSEDLSSGEQAVCPFFHRTAACRFGVQCTRLHPKPALSQTILIPNFFSHFALEQTLRDEYNTDLSLEYEDSELYKEFLVFYHEVLPELRMCGDVIQFKVCCNYEAHLRGNVYVQYKDIRQAVEAYRKFNGRFFNGKQLSLDFVKIESWRSAICGLFSRKRCLKGRICSYLHVFRNPTKEFVSADNDWKQLPQAKRSNPPAKSPAKAAASVSTPDRTPKHTEERERSRKRSQSPLRDNPKKLKTVDESASTKESHNSRSKSKKSKSKKEKKHKEKKRKKEKKKSKKRDH